MEKGDVFAPIQKAVTTMLPLSAKEWNAFTDILIYRQVPKKFLLVNVGHVCREAYFINKGCARLYFIKEGEEISANFIFENGFISSYESYLLKTPSRQAIETLEDCELVVFKKDALDELSNRYPKFHIFSKLIAEMAFVILQRRASSFILDSPEERYLSMLQQHPLIAERVPQHMIASYLGITPVSLSRLRKRISG